MPTTYQSRLAPIHDNIRRKVLDRLQDLIGLTTDAIRITYKKDKVGDIITHIVEAADVIQVVWPAMKDLPARDLKKENGEYAITSLVSAVAAGDASPPEHYKVNIPRKYHIQVGDLIFRVFIEPDMLYPILLGVEITEKLVTFGTNSTILNAYNVAIYTQELPKKIVDVIGSMTERRLFLKW